MRQRANDGTKSDLHLTRRVFVQGHEVGMMLKGRSFVSGSVMTSYRRLRSNEREGESEQARTTRRETEPEASKRAERSSRLGGLLSMRDIAGLNTSCRKTEGRVKDELSSTRREKAKGLT